MKIDAHHHLWDLKKVHYPWLMEDAVRFFGDPKPIPRNYLLAEFSADARSQGFEASVHIQVGAEDGFKEAEWVDMVVRYSKTWPMVQVVFCDLTAPDVITQLDRFKELDSVVGVRQIVGRAPEEDARTGTNALLNNPDFVKGLHAAAERGFSFDLQLVPELMPRMAEIVAQIPNLKVVLCHAGSPYDHSTKGLDNWAAQLRYLSELPNVWCKLSGLGMFDHDWTVAKIKPIVNQVLAQFGIERVMFGSNFPVDSLSSDYHTLFHAYRELVPAGGHDAVFGGTASAFYFDGRD